MDENDSILACNERFYRAFREADIETMMRLWSSSDDVACIHPGWPALRGRERVIASWRAIMLDHRPPQVECARVEVFRFGPLAFITCVERIPEVDTELAATNVFRLEDGEWQILHHHSGPVRLPFDVTDLASSSEDGPEPDPEPTLN
ncbi:MAG: nuclear transport factor 2 family protein [Myxococcota bacterium]